MTFITRSVFSILTTSLALAANACAGSVTHVESVAPALECEGGLIASAADAEHYAGCAHVAGDLRISAPDLDDLSDFSALRSVSGKLEIAGNPRLQDLTGLERLEHAQSLTLRDNASLFQARGLASLQQVEQLVVENNPQLNSLQGMRSLSRAGSVQIRNNPRLCALGLLPALSHVDGELTLRDNRGLSRPELRQLLGRIEQASRAEPSVARLEASLR